MSIFIKFLKWVFFGNPKKEIEKQEEKSSIANRYNYLGAEDFVFNDKNESS